MVNRQQMILLQLSMAKGPVTSDQLAQMLECSSRRVKAEMTAVAEVLAKNGAKLISKRNQGYSIEVQDVDAYRSLYELLSLKAVNLTLANSNEESRLLYLARKLVASPRGVKAEELAEELYLSRSALREPLRRACIFCESFHLKTRYAAGQGIRVNGPEHLIRIAMTELFELHFHKARLDATDQEYAQWIGCEYEERQNIRHTFLKVLRESGYSLRDSVTQRIAMYLIIARNRTRGGLYVDLPPTWMQELHPTPVYAVARTIYATLAEQFDGYRMNTAETAFLAIYILSNMDVDLTRDLRGTAPFLYEDCCAAADQMLLRVQRETGTDFAPLPGAVPILQQLVLPLLAGVRYGMDGYQHFDYSYEKEFLKSPLCVQYARYMAAALTETTGCRVSQTDISILSCYVCALLNQVKYDIKPLRILTTHFIGTQFARMQAKDLQKRYPDLIESITGMELYEIRGTDPKDYDVVLVGNGSAGQGLFGYNYPYPASLLLMTQQGRDYNRIHNDVLINAYQLPELVQNPERIRVIQDFRFLSPEQFFQFISLRHAKDEAARNRMETDLTQQEAQYSLVKNECVVVFGQAAACRHECMELYVLHKKSQWNTERVKYILFVCMDCVDSLQKVKALETVLSELTNNQEKTEQFAQNPVEALHSLLRQSLQTE